MTIEIKQSYSPNFAPEEIPVEFLVIHYSACSLEGTLEIFHTPARKVCAHFIVDQDGSIYDLGNFWSGPILRAAHAGKSIFDLDGRKWEGMNAYSIGVELINFNGNVMPYPQAQMDSLSDLAKHLVSRFPALQNPHRVVGHEQIAGFRGKVDPGILFDWEDFFKQVYPDLKNYPERAPVLTAPMIRKFEEMNGKINSGEMRAEDWSALSAKLEAFVGEENTIKSQQA